MKISYTNLNQKYINVYRLIICMLGWTNLVLLIVFTNEVTKNGRIFSLYAFQANVLALVWLTISIIFYKKNEKPKFLHLGVQGAVSSYTIIALLTYIFLLAPRDSYAVGIHFFTSLTLHIIIPTAVFLDWFLTNFKIKYKWSYLLYWSIYPIGYLGYCIISGVLFNDPFYDFFDINKMGIIGLIGAILGLMVFFLLMDSLYIFINRKLYDKFQK